MVLTNASIIVGGYDLSGYSNRIEVTYGAEILDATTFKIGTTRINTVGLRTLMITGGGLMDPAVDLTLFNGIGMASVDLSLAPIGEGVGDVAFLTRGISGTYQPISGEIGQLMEFELNFSAAGYPLIRGSVGAIGVKTASGQSAGIQIVGGVPTGKVLYAALHATAVSGTTPTLDAVVESDDASGFPSPTTRITLAQLTDEGSVWGQVAGPITDDWFRMKWTIGGTTPSFTVYGTLGIL